MCRMMVSILALSLCSGIATLPSQGEPQSSKLDRRARDEWAKGNPLRSPNWSLRLKAIELDPEKGVKRVSGVLCNLSREAVCVDKYQICRDLSGGLRLWPREASGSYSIHVKPSVRINPGREIITLRSGQEVDISWQMGAIAEIYQLAYSSRYIPRLGESSPARLKPGLFVVDGEIELVIHEAKKDGTRGKRLGAVVVHTDNKLWVDVGEVEQANRGE